MLGVRNVKLLVKIPRPEPSNVLWFEVVGLAAVLQQTPRVVTGAPPSEIIFPPDVKEFSVRPDTAVVVNEGNIATVPVVKVKSLP